MVAVAAVMEAPAILSALWLVSRSSKTANVDAGLYREILLNGSIVLLVGSFFIGAITGQDGLDKIAPFIVSPFQGVLCIFLLDMGLVADRGLRESRSDLGGGAVAFEGELPLPGLEAEPDRTPVGEVQLDAARALARDDHVGLLRHRAGHLAARGFDRGLRLAARP